MNMHNILFVHVIVSCVFTKLSHITGSRLLLRICAQLVGIITV